ncbi:MAG: hypothetical protein ACXW5U_03890 [Thermoanaerobaculia bacterium]
MRQTKYCLLVFLSLVGLPLFAQATRTWVSGVGDDANPCSRTAPCKTFAGAISKTAAGGEISVLDPGGFGAVTITKSITINGTGTLASILSSGTNGIVINAAGINVNLINLSINGGTPTSPGINGIRIIAANRVSVSQCDIFNYSNAGIDDERTTAGSTIVTNTRIFNGIQSGVSTTTFGIRVRPSSGAAANTLVCDQCTIFGNTLSNAHGIFIVNGARAVITRSSVQSNTFGITVTGPGGAAEVTVTDSDVSRNATGVLAQAGGTARLAAVSITGNTTNGLNFAGGTIASFGNNYIAGNSGNNGAGLTPVSPQ